MSHNPYPAVVMLAAEHDVTVTEEKFHQAALEYFPVPHQTVAHLHVAPIARGRHAGSAGIVVSIDGRTVGALTFAMAQRYLPIVDPLLRQGQQPACWARIKTGRRGLIEVSLKLPRTRAGDRPDVGSRPTPSRPAGRKSRKGLWIGLGITGVIVVGSAVSGGGEQAAPNPSAVIATAPSQSAAPTTTAPTTTTAPPTTNPQASTNAQPSVLAQAPRTSAAARQTTTRPVSPTREPQAAAKPTTKAAGSGCDSNYSGCVPIASDVDCAGGSGNGPAYARGPVRVIGTDIYGLDNDKDGIGCE